MHFRAYQHKPKHDQTVVKKKKKKKKLKQEEVYCILVTIETGVVEPSVRITDTQSQRGIVRYSSLASSQTRGNNGLTIRRKIINKVQIVSPEIHTTEGCPSWHSKAGGSAACQRSIQIWGYGQGAGESIVQARHGNGGPDYVYCVVRLGGWIGGLADEVGRPATGNVYLESLAGGREGWKEDTYLFGVVPGRNQNYVGICASCQCYLKFLFGWNSLTSIVGQ
jgi:hypothetical protein